MQNTLRKQYTRDQMLDYLFQEPMETQFEALRAIQNQPQQAGSGWMKLISRVFQRESGDN